MVSLIMKKQIDEITVSELIKTADVGKSTFYRYYHDIYDVFEEITDEFAERVLNVMLYLVFSGKEGEFDGYENTIDFDIAMELFGLKDADKVLVDYLFRTRSMKTFHLVVERFREAVKNYTKNTPLDSQQADYFTKFVMNGVLYSSLDDYKENKNFNMQLVKLLRSFSIGELSERSAGLNG